MKIRKKVKKLVENLTKEICNIPHNCVAFNLKEKGACIVCMTGIVRIPFAALNILRTRYASFTSTLLKNEEEIIRLIGKEKFKRKIIHEIRKLNSLMSLTCKCCKVKTCTFFPYKNLYYLNQVYLNKITIKCRLCSGFFRLTTEDFPKDPKIAPHEIEKHFTIWERQARDHRIIADAK